jgi:hypothetical protein
MPLFFLNYTPCPRLQPVIGKLPYISIGENPFITGGTLLTQETMGKQGIA